MSLDELARPFVVEQVGKPEGWFALDSTLGGDEFEPSVPGRERVSPFGNETGHRGARGSLVTVAHLTGDRGFESISLQRRVSCELDSPGFGHLHGVRHPGPCRHNLEVGGAGSEYFIARVLLHHPRAQYLA